MLRDFSKEEFDIIIQAGQSNSEGCGQGDAQHPFAPYDKILQMEGDFSISLASEKIWGNNIVGNYSHTFCEEYLKDGRLKEGRKLLILKTSVGGTGFLDKRWGPQDDLYLRMMEMIKTTLELNPSNRLVALIWHQGETDAILGATKQLHYDNLSGLVGSVRSTFGYPALPFVAGDFVSHWKGKNLAICEPVVDAIKSVCADIGHASFVETSELLSNDQQIGNGDDIHFSREALNQLGVKYYIAYKAL
ncbi:MAG: sialate O-acetylesterase [Eubacteriales bacterium]